MKQLAIICALLVVPWIVANALGADVEWAGGFGLVLVFAFTGLRHFVRTDAMNEMLPRSIPGRRALILASEIFELLLAILLLALAEVTTPGTHDHRIPHRDISGKRVCGPPTHPIRRTLRGTNLFAPSCPRFNFSLSSGHMGSW